MGLCQDVLVVGDHELLLAFGDEALEAADALASGDELAFGDGDLLLELGVLLDELPLHERELLQVALEEGELLLLLLAVGAPEDGVVLLARGVEGYLELDDTLASVLQVAHKGLLDRVEVGELLVHGGAVAARRGLLAQSLELGAHARIILLLARESLLYIARLSALFGLLSIGVAVGATKLGLTDQALGFKETLSKTMELVGWDSLAGIGKLQQTIELLQGATDMQFAARRQVIAEIKASHHLCHALLLQPLLLIEHRTALLGGHPSVQKLVLHIIELRCELTISLLEGIHGDGGLLGLEFDLLDLHAQLLALGTQALAVAVRGSVGLS